MTRDRQSGLFQYIPDGAKRRGNKMNSGKKYTVGKERLNLRQIVERTTANMYKARRDIVNGTMSAEDFINKYKK